MLTYENFVAVLLTAIEQTDLNIAYTQELLDTHALGRSLSITCLPHGVEDDRAPEEPPLRAVIAFRWSPEFTVGPSPFLSTSICVVSGAVKSSTLPRNPVRRSISARRSP